ncbi:hypothetical protein CHARACLAT_001084 [Characodon lateralis]|uniref:Secreted protein n=1 Tax=Characodon lateralis TaxID=208331 RepID=A0ABU7DXA1_9TELE|nr:hypothetical protein [Characodon lateralis]
MRCVCVHEIPRTTVFLITVIVTAVTDASNANKNKQEAGKLELKDDVNSGFPCPTSEVNGTQHLIRLYEVAADRAEGRAGWAEQWECGAGIVGENLGWSHSVWSAPPLPSSSFCSAAKAISTSY